jgi:hypothetical protein
MQRRHYFYGLAGVLLVALVARALLLMSGAVSFHSDEAVVALMARHITLGERPVFFYGQAYMGSLDAWANALGFQLLGESVNTIRLVQSALFMGVVASVYHAAWVLSGWVRVAVGTGLLFAVGPVLLTLYTTATLGGYNETLIFGHLMVAIGYGVVSGRAASDQRPATSEEPEKVRSTEYSVLASAGYQPIPWFVLGLIGGLAWWTNALIVIYAVPVGVFLLVRLVQARDRQAWGMLSLALIGFVIGSAPWWIYAIQNDLAPLRFLLPTGLRGGYVGAELPDVPISDRVIGLFLFGLPAVVGMRFPWEGTFFLAPLGLLVLLIALIGFYRLVRARPAPLRPGAAWILLGMLALMGIVFLLTRFSSDPSGRYFLPLTLPFALAISTLAFPRTESPQPSGAGRWSVVLLALALVYFAAGQFSAARGPLGMTTQFNTETHLPNSDDAALIEWLLANDLRHGYTNFWISFRIAFLSAEQIQLSAALPDTSRLRYTTAFERYPPYREATDAAERVAYITALVPGADAGMEAWLAAGSISYQTQQIGIYRVYYDFAPAAPRPPVPFAVE